MPRFVILVHDWPAWHWDFFLEAGPVLKAWRLWAEPGYGKGIPAEPMFDHRLFYLDYEGPLSDGRGSVTRWDTGTFEIERVPSEDETDLILFVLRKESLATL